VEGKGDVLLRFRKTSKTIRMGCVFAMSTLRNRLTFRSFWIPALAVLLSSCASKGSVEPPPQLAEYRDKLEEANALFDKGCYSSLDEAFRLYQELLSYPFDPGPVHGKRFETVLLLALREKELGMLDGPYQKRTVGLLPEEAPAELALYMDIVNATSVRTKGVVDDSLSYYGNLRILRRIQSSEESMRLLRARAESQPFGAYLYLSLVCSSSSTEDEDIGFLVETHSIPLPILFKSAICQGEDRELLEEIVRGEPCFGEAHFFLGETAVKRGHLLTAENHYSKAYQQFPSSLAILSSLASIHFRIGETEKSLEFHEEVLTLAPEHRDALLGKAICLGYMGEHRRAIEVLDTMVSLGRWYLGEANYWLAWNEHSLEHLETARGYVEKSKAYLPMDSKAFGLSGVIAYEQGRMAAAERNLVKALRFDSANCEAAFYLAAVHSHKMDWESSGRYYEEAARCHADTGKWLEDVIDEIKTSTLSDDRKQQLIYRRGVQLAESRLNEATSFYNAAAGYFNSSMSEKALNCAQRASAHRLFEERAEELIGKLRELK
jgi:tetratricopeptide (TPR) repeat protein